jgi:allophanate hydrolase subunit 1
LFGLCFAVMAGLDPAIHVLLLAGPRTWMPGTSPGMTESAS